MGSSDETKNYKVGIKTRTRILGKDYVMGTINDATKLDRKFQKFITESAWGTVWSGNELSDQERSLITISLLAALGHQDELAMHLKAAKNLDLDLEKVSEAIMHVAIYAGIPEANKAFKVLKRVSQEIAERSE